MAQGLIRLGKTFGDDRLEAACRRALTLGTVSYRRIHDTLKAGLDREPLEPPQSLALPTEHDNIRGPDYYH